MRKTARDVLKRGEKRERQRKRERESIEDSLSS